MKRVALVTGGARGIGRATAELLTINDWQVVQVDLDAGDGAPCWKVDLADEVAVEQLFKRVIADYGRLDGLVNNAAQQLVRPLVETTGEEWDRAMANNVRSAFLCSKYAFPLLAASRGAIVNVSSVHSQVTSAGLAAYVASKGAVTAMTRAAALEFAPLVRVNAVHPGATDTPMLRDGAARSNLDVDEALRELALRHPLQRVATPEEVGQAIMFLLDSTRSSFITGSSLFVDGGATARLSVE